MNFLPDNYTPPTSGGQYYRLQDGVNKFRILSSPILGWLAWDRHGDKPTPVRTEYTKEGYARALEIAQSNTDARDKTPRHFWAMKVWDCATEEVKVFEITQKSIQAKIAHLAKDADWGNPVGAYDISITKEGAGMETTYNFVPIPPKPLSADAQAKIDSVHVNLQALFYSADPFDETWIEPTDIDDVF